MDQGKVEDWMIIGSQCAERQSRMPLIIKSMLRQLEEQVDGFAINQLQHGLQTATRALRDGASEEMVVAALCHDIGCFRRSCLRSRPAQRHKFTPLLPARSR
jgi:predicted HD phosphohydrolase